MMFKSFVNFASICVLFVFSSHCVAKQAASVADIVNSDKVEYGAIITPFGLYVTRAQGPWGKSGRSSIIEIDAATYREKMPSFSAQDFSDSDPFFDSTGNRICFVSTRPVNPDEQENQNGDIWCADRQATVWGKPYRLDEPVNSPATEYSPVFDAAGQLYFASDRAGGFGQGDIYTATVEKSNNASIWTVSNLGDAINTPFGEWNVGIRADGKALLFEASERPENRSVPGDLYYSEWIDDRWSNAVAVSRLNTHASELMARWQSAGDIIFASARKGNGDVDHYSSAALDWQPIKPSLIAVSRSRAEVVILDPNNLAVQSRVKIGVGSHEIASSDDGRTAIVPSLGIYPEPHINPVNQRPPFVSKPSEGVTIADLVTGEVRQMQLKDCIRPHGVATDNQASRFWITCEQHGTIVEFDTLSLTQQRQFNVGKGVHKVWYAQNTLIASNPDSGEIYRIELNTGKVSTLNTGKGAEGMVLNSDNQTLWVANSQDATVCQVEVKSMLLQWCNSTGGAFPIALAYIASKNELWVSRLATSDIAILSAQDGSQLNILTLPTGALGLVANRDGSIVYASLPRHNKVIAINTKSHEVIASSDEVMEGDDIILVR